MGSLLSYSGITTKVRALSSFLLTKSDYAKMSELESVSEVVGYLKNNPTYEDEFEGLDENNLHRDEIERILRVALYNDFTKLYSFSNMKQREFLAIYSIHYEVYMLKTCLRLMFNHGQVNLDLSCYYSFFNKYSKINLEKLTSSNSIEEFINFLVGTPYYDVLWKFLSEPHPTLFDYEMALDTYYFSSVWKSKSKSLQGKDGLSVKAAYGAKLDLLNIEWIFRSKHYFHMEDADIYELIIPVNYRLKKEDIHNLVEAANAHDFYEVLSHTYYGRKFDPSIFANNSLEDIFSPLLDRIYSIESRKNPYSVAILHNYLFQREKELTNVVTVVEGVRYRLPPTEILQIIKKA